MHNSLFSDINNLLELAKSIANPHYVEPPRHFHTWKHVEQVLAKLAFYSDELSPTELSILQITAIWHDVVYIPASASNEQDSVDLFLKFAKETNYSEFLADQVANLILETHEFNLREDTLGYYFARADWEIMFSRDSFALLEYEKQICKEFQFANYAEYKQKRLEFVKKAIALTGNKEGMSFLIKQIEAFRPKIAVMPLDFSHFTDEDFNSISKVETLFDKVVLFGVNPETWPDLLDGLNPGTSLLNHPKFESALLFMEIEDSSFIPLENYVADLSKVAKVFIFEKLGDAFKVKAS